MLNWALGFFVAAIIAAVFGFGAVASDFASIALLLFWVFVALFVVTLIMSLFMRTGEGGPSGALAVIATVIVVGFLIYAWNGNHMSAESVGRSIDHSASRISADARDVIDKAGDRAGSLMHRTTNDVRETTANGLDRAQHAVQPTSRDRERENERKS